MKVKFNVTAEDISKGCRGLAMSCPVALAMRRRLRIDVSVDYFFIFFPPTLIQIPTPKIILDFANDFDEGHGMPGSFSFELDLPDCLCTHITEDPECTTNLSSP